MMFCFNGLGYRLFCCQALILASVFTSYVGDARGETTRYYSLEGFGDLLKGNPESTALTEEGAVVLPPQSVDWYSNTSESYSAATAHDGNVVVARVGDGAILSVDSKGQTTQLYKAAETVVTSLHSAYGALYVAAGPPARVYRIESDGSSKLFFEADASYIWDMATGKSGNLYITTGEPGMVVEVSADGNGTILFQPEQEHLKTVAYDESLGLFVGGGERGIVYRSVEGKPKTFQALCDIRHPEVTAILLRGKYAYVAGVQGAASLASDVGHKPHGRSKNSKGDVRSTLIRVGMDGTTDVMAGSSDEVIFDMAFGRAGTVLVSTGATDRDDPRGRLYSVSAEQRMVSLLYQSPSRRITHMVSLGEQSLAAVAAGGGRVTYLSGDLAKRGEFFSEAIDTEINSTYGAVHVHGETPSGTRATVALRSGQTATPDETWSPWSDEIDIPGGATVRVQNGRYFQVRATLEGSGDVSPSVYRVRVAYLRQNLPPFVREIVAMKKGIALRPVPRAEVKSKTISLSGKSSRDRKNGSSQQPKPRIQKARQIHERGALTVRWSADDPNGDTVTYDLMIRSTGEKAWRTLDEKMEYPFYTIRSAQLPDGHYQFRVLASDSVSNPVGYERNDTRESKSILIDNTPPSVQSLAVSVLEDGVTIEVEVSDNVGPLTEAYYSLDGQDFRMVAPEDGVLDGPGESFSIGLGKLSTGKHVITVRVVDDADNEGFGEARFDVP